jgi:hypothetical protein
VIDKRLFILLACLFVVMIGLGITQPVLSFYVERLALGEALIRTTFAATSLSEFTVNTAGATGTVSIWPVAVTWPLAVMLTVANPAAVSAGMT